MPPLADPGIDFRGPSAYAHPLQGRPQGGPFLFDYQGMTHEADLSAEQSGAGTPARVPCADGNAGRPQRDSRAPRTRSQEAVGVIETPVGGADIRTISRRADFLAANAGKRAPMPGFVLLMRQRDDGDPMMRIGYTVTKKIGNAVIRNRLKRRLRALARDLLPESGVRGADHVLIGRGDGLTRDFAQLKVDLGKALAKVVR
jgi:ribonuclease P protein component